MAATSTKLSQHGEKRPFQTIWREQGENYHGQEANNPSRENFLPQTTTHQPHRAHTPVQNSPSNPRTGTRRYKTLPAQQKTHNSAHLARAGRKLSRPGRKQPEQGELFPANHHSPATQRTLPGTKLSRQPRPQGQTGTKLSQHTACKAKPVQNSPSTAKNAHFRPFGASRENFFPVQTQKTQAGRTFYRKPPLTSRTGHTHRYKTPLANPRTGAHTNAGGRADSLSARPPGPSSNDAAQSLTA